MSEKSIPAAVETATSVVENTIDAAEEVTGRTVNPKVLLLVGVGVAAVTAGTVAFLKIRKARKAAAEVTEEVVTTDEA